MAQSDIILPTEPPPEPPKVRSIGAMDLWHALHKGLEDFSAIPTHTIFLCLIYPIVGIALGWATFGLNVIPLLFPLAAGFALVGPFAAIGLYELSRRRELGLDTSWKHAFDIRHSPSLPAIVALGLLLLVILGTWLVAAQAIYVANFRNRSRWRWRTSPACCSARRRVTTSSSSATRSACSSPSSRFR
jgi:uncharacterized membrane protein